MGAYQLKIIIKGSKPPIWRRVLVPEGITFEELHKIIQTVFCWSDDHLYQFEFRSEKVRIVSDENNKSSKLQNLSCNEKIDDLVSGAKKFTYTYNFENSWEHVIEIEDIAEDYKDRFAQVVKYKGDSIPEDCGGIQGYYEFLEAASDSEKQAVLQEYDMSAVNNRLNKNGNSLAKVKESVYLEDIYDCYDKSSMTEIARRHNMKDYAKLSKKELIKAVIAHILDKEVMKSYFLCVRDAEIKLFEQLIAGNNKVESFESDEMDFLYAGGYVTAGTDDNFLVSQEVKEAYGQLNTPEFQKEREYLSNIGDYLCAANSLYAITPISVVLETYNKYEEKKISGEQLLHAYELLVPYRLMVQYMDGKFIDAALVEQNSFDHFYNLQKKVPYYIPTQEEICYMADHAGFLMTSELSQLSDFITEEMNVSDDKIPYLLSQIQAEISIGGQLQEVLDAVEADGIIFESDEQVEKFTSIITDVWNHTRMILNRGHKPYEMVMKGLDDTSIQRKNIKKIYPNEPCPCGSGKKYKKCCGKIS